MTTLFCYLNAFWACLCQCLRVSFCVPDVCVCVCVRIQVFKIICFEQLVVLSLKTDHCVLPEVDLQPYDKNGAITYRVMGGILDFFVFSGPSSEDVVRQYVSLIGSPIMPPFWSLGFHLCKHGYGNSSEFWKVIQRNRAAKMPYVSFMTGFFAVLHGRHRLQLKKTIQLIKQSLSSV